MGLKKVKNILINEDKYVYPFPELIIQTTRNVNHVQHLGSDLASNDNGYIYFYTDADWRKNPNVYIGESKNSIQSRHNGTHKNTEWFKSIKYPFIGIINSPNLPWDTDTRRAIESKTVFKLHSIGLKLVNGANSTWTSGGTVHPSVNNQYVEDVSEIIVDYIIHQLGYTIPSNNLDKDGGKNIQIKNKSFTYHETKLIDLLQAGFLQPETELHSTKKLYQGSAILLSDGTIKFNNEIFKNVSSAGIALIRTFKPDAISVNGWEFWGIMDSSGKLKTLHAIREEHDSANRND